MAIKTDEKPNPQLFSHVKLNPQEIAEAIKAKAVSPEKAFFNFPGKGNVDYGSVLEQARRILEQNYLSSWSKLDDKTLVLRLRDAIVGRRLKVFQPKVGASISGMEEEPPLAMAETASAIPEEEPSTMSDTAPANPTNPLGSFPGSNQPSSQPMTPRRVFTTIPSTRAEVQAERVTQMEAGAQGPASEKIDKMSPATKKIDQMKARENIQPASSPTFLHAAPPFNPPVSALQPPKTPVSFKSLSKSIGNIKMPSSLGSPLKNFTSSAGRFFKTNFGKFLNLSNFSRVGSSVIGGFTGMGIAGTAGAGAGAVGGLFAPEILKAGGGRMLGAIANKGTGKFMSMSNGIRRTSGRVSQISGSIKKGAGKKVAFGLLGLFFGASLLMALVGGATTSESSPLGSQNQTPGSNTAGGTCPSQATLAQNTDHSSCHYLNPGIDIFDTNISQESINTYVNNYSPIFKGTKDEFILRVNYIVAQAKKAQLNPVIFLGYWKTESRFSTIGERDMGCAGDTFEAQVDCAVGLSPLGNRGSKCATSKAADSPSCVELRDTIRGAHPDIYTNYPLKYPISTFDDFAEAYGPIAPNLDPGQTNNNCTHTYNDLISVAKELNSCHAASTPTTRQSTNPGSCPVPNGVLTCGSQMTPVNGPLGLCGHCGAGYTSSDEVSNCQKFPELKYSLDIQTSASQPVFLPTINEHTVSWRFIAPGINTPNGYIQKYFGEDLTNQEKYWLQIHHTEFDSGNIGLHRSGEQAAVSCSTCGQGHVHVQLRSDTTGSWLDAAQILCK